MARSVADERETGYVSNAPQTVQSLANEAQRRFQSNRNGTNSQFYPAHARVPSEPFGVWVVGTGGQVHASASQTNFRNRSIAELSAGLDSERSGGRKS